MADLEEVLPGIFMSDAQFERWMKALRSGEFPQSSGALYVSEPNPYQRTLVTPHTPAGYCCMGLAGRVCLSLSDEAMTGRGLLRLNEYKTKEMHPFSGVVESTLAHLNDTRKLTFPQIAAFIEGGGLSLVDFSDQNGVLDA